MFRSSLKERRASAAV